MAEALNLQNALTLARNVPALAATVTVVDDAGKVVTTSKNIFGAFKQAREAYKARKAEIAAERSGEATRRREARLREARKLERRERKLLTAGTEEAEDGEEAQRKKEKKRSKSRKNRSASPDEEEEASSSALTRRDSESTESETIYSPAAMAMMHNNASLLTLAPAMLVAGDPLAETLQMLLMQLQNTIDEMSCITAGIGALISELQKVPDTLAVVGLTLAEISAIVAKISPAAIMGLKSAFPVIFGLLGSPQFAVVAGVGIAATVVVLGGYRIIKNVVGAGPKDPDEEERDLDLEFGVTTLPDDIEEPVAAPVVAASPPKAIMPPPAPLEVQLNALNIQGDAEKEKERRKTKRRDSEKSVKAVKSEKSLKSVSSDRSDKDRSHRPSAERRESRKHDKSEKRERGEKVEKRDKSDRHDRSDSSKRSDKGERSDKSEKGDKSERSKSDKSKSEKKKDLTINPGKFSLTRRATAPASPMEPSRPSLSKRTMTIIGSASKSEEKLKAPKKKLLAGLFDGRS